MKTTTTIIQPFFLLLGLGIAFGTLWMDWARLTIFFENGRPRISSISDGWIMLGNPLASTVAIFYPLAVGATLIASKVTLQRRTSQLIFKVIFYINLGILTAFFWQEYKKFFFPVLGDLISNQTSSWTWLGGYWVWIFANVVILSWLWKVVYGMPVKSVQEDILDEDVFINNKQ